MFIEPIGCIRALRPYLFPVLLGIIYDFFNKFTGNALTSQRIINKGMVEANRRIILLRKGNLGNNFSGIVFRINSIFLAYKLHRILLAESSMP